MREQKGMFSRRATFLWVERWARSHCPAPCPPWAGAPTVAPPLPRIRPPALLDLGRGFSKDEVQEHWGQRESAGEWPG